MVRGSIVLQEGKLLWSPPLPPKHPPPTPAQSDKPAVATAVVEEGSQWIADASNVSKRWSVRHSQILLEQFDLLLHEKASKLISDQTKGRTHEAICAMVYKKVLEAGQNLAPEPACANGEA